MNKKGQFFLIAALVIVGIIITLSAVNISTKTPAKKNTAFYDLSKEIDYESSKLIDYGVYNKRESDTGKLITSLVANYSSTHPDTDFLFVYGNAEDGVSSTQYSRVSSGLTSVGSATSYQYETDVSYPETDIDVTHSTISVTLDETETLDFELSPGENFYIVLTKEVGEETLVAQE